MSIHIEAPKFRKNRWKSAQFDESWDSMGFPRNDVNVGPKDLRCSLAAPGLHRYTVLVAPGVVRKCNGYSKTLYVTLCDYGT